jgi:predicted glycosyl hydrolase (DUF1957 family)
MTVAELLKAANVKDEVIAGLPPDVVTALTGYVSQADTTLQTAAQKEAEAAEALRQAEFAKSDTQKYVEEYGVKLDKTATLEANNKAMVAYLETLKAQGYDVQIPTASAEAAKPVVPGSPAIGANAVDEGRILGRVGNVMSQWMDANNEHIRLYGTPIPDPSTSVAEEAARARKPIGEYLAEKYKFSDKRREKTAADMQKEKDAYAKQKVDEALRAQAEKYGNNPNLRAGETSRNSVIPIKHDEFEKATGNVPRRERLNRMLENVHKDVAAARSA